MKSRHVQPVLHAQQECLCFVRIMSTSKSPKHDAGVNIFKVFTWNSYVLLVDSTSPFFLYKKAHSVYYRGCLKNADKAQYLEGVYRLYRE